MLYVYEYCVLRFSLAKGRLRTEDVPPSPSLVTSVSANSLRLCVDCGGSLEDDNHERQVAEIPAK